MHGLILLDGKNELLRHTILWNNTRTTAQCEKIYDVVGEERLLAKTKNPALEGFTLPKILWMKEHVPVLYSQTKTFLLPKDYIRYKLTGKLQMEYSDAAGTLLLNISEKVWNIEICELLEIDPSICPPLVNSGEEVGTITPDFA